MKRLIYSILLISLISCNKDESPEIAPIAPISCFEVSKTNVNVGEEIQITNCSKGANEYLFDLGNDSMSTEIPTKIVYQIPGSYEIGLLAKSEDGKTNYSSKIILVDSIEHNYIYSSVLVGYGSSPMDFNLNNDKFYFIESYYNYAVAKRGYYYVEIGESYNFSKKYIMDNEYNPGSAFLVPLNNGNIIINTVECMTYSIFSQEIKLDANWYPQSLDNNISGVKYGCLETNENYIYYGLNENTTYKSPFIEVRNGLGEVINQVTYNEIEQGFIGDLIETDDGFIGFGGTFTPVDYYTFNSYKPLVLFLNKSYELTKHISYEDEVLKTTITNFRKISGKFHIKKLSDNKIILYSQNVFRIIDLSGNEIKSKSFEQSDLYHSDKQGIITLANGGFILSAKEYLHKYNENGDLIKSLKFNGEITPSLILKDNQIYFISAYWAMDYIEALGSTMSMPKTFFGSVDTDLNIIKLN